MKHNRNKTIRQKKYITIIYLIILLTVLNTAVADSGVPGWIHSVVQEGQDIVIAIEISEEGFSNHYRLERKYSNKVHKVFDNKVFIKENDADIRQYCYHGNQYEQDCIDGIESQCFDCDNNGIEECPDSCINKYLFSILQECVSDGKSKYSLFYSINDYWEIADWEEIDVEDVGQDCRETDAGSDSDTDTDNDTDTDTDTDADTDTDTEADDEEKSDSGNCSMSPCSSSGNTSLFDSLLLFFSFLI